MKPRVLSSVLLVVMLGACGAPGSDTVFTKGNPKLNPGVDSAVATAPAVQPARLRTSLYRGYYRRLGDESGFQPCGTRQLLTIFGPPEARMALHERFRFSSPVQGQKMFGVFEGAIIVDTLRAVPPDTIGKLRTRFLIVRVDTLRTWDGRDCGGMRVP